MPISRFSRSSSGIIVSASGMTGASVAPRDGGCLLCNRYDAHGPDHLETIAQIGKGLDIAAAHQGSSAAPRPQPLGIELADVTLSQRAVFAIASALRLGKLRREQ